MEHRHDVLRAFEESFDRWLGTICGDARIQLEQTTAYRVETLPDFTQRLNRIPNGKSLTPEGALTFDTRERTGFQRLTDSFLLTTSDKSIHNFAIMCPKHAAQLLLQDLATQCHGGDSVYQLSEVQDVQTKLRI